MNKTVIPVRGMHCRSCEIIIHDKLMEISEIKSVQVNYKKKQVTIYSRQPLDMSKIEASIIGAGYEVGTDDSKHWISLDPNTYAELAKSLVILLILYFIAKKFGLFNINLGSSNNPSSLAMVLLVGLTASVSTCMALVGGLVLGISARHSEKHPEATPIQKFRPHLFFNIGRILSYIVLGGVIGLVGKVFQLTGTLLGVVTILVGFVMLILGAQLIEIFPRLSNSGITVPTSISKFLGIKKHHEREYSHLNSAIVGALTFFLPCGFTQAMQLYAMTTGSFWSGALIMGTFALGTALGLLGIGGLTSALHGSNAKKFFRFVGLLIIFLAIFNISNGYRLTGIDIKFPTQKTTNSNNTTKSVDTENGVQIIRMDQLYNGYSPNSFTIKKGVPVKWIIESKDDNSCASSLYASKIGVRKYLQLGENIIEFTPTETGRIPFSCSMGMYRGSFTVID